ncbi:MULTISPECIES: DUF2993 domain-containing protein [Streptomyces]|uniref:DUF2993 domain-containing protein n=1 Tax=Streptomyces albus (strain ATCC 21838 / DSM 41398 / FERM P-419 / JCM 4703 / NBRC 107858) TaxID=1081613 RepID=A0A0B5EYK0_STRA4|nr:DUF2993 domain-containing protein [Streptomyces sp. SCSIO ZS0520]AJE84445.1 hypothetical protein SLNWT_4069 [Streptomyces albus]AOU78756.1 hypothetical protein SLNHY_4065 [Streptomyces albus]
MRALRITLIVLVVLGGLFVAVDRIAVNYAEGKAADKVRESEGLDKNPDVSIKGFPFLTQAAGGTLDEVEVRMDDYRARTETPAGSQDGQDSTREGADSVLIERLDAKLHDVEFSGDYSSATAKRADGTATISYAELLKAAQVEPMELAPGVTAKVTGLSDGGNGRIKVEVKATVLGRALPDPVYVMSSARVDDDIVKVHADALPKIPVKVAEDKVREITDFQQRISGLPAGIHLDRVEAAEDGVEVSVTGAGVKLGS